MSAYTQNAIVLSGLGPISKKIFQHPSHDVFISELPIEMRPLNNPRDIRLPASYFKKIDSVERSEIEEQRNLIWNTITQSEEKDFCFESDRPLKSKIVSQYASYRQLQTGYRYFHMGLDLRAWLGTPIPSAGTGTVKLARFFHTPGNAVIIDHGNFIYSKYFHMSEILVQEGETAQVGQILGKSGGTGRAEAPHLHWEMSWRGIQMDPLDFIRVHKTICKDRDVSPLIVSKT